MDGKRKRSLRARRDIEERRTSSRNVSRMSYDEQDTTASELSDFASYVQNYARIYSRNPELNDQDSLRLLERSGSPSSASDVVDGQPRARKRNKSSYSSNGDKTSARQSRDTDDSSVSPKSSPKKRKHQDDAKGRLVSPRVAAEALLQAEVISISSTDPDDIQERSQDAADDRGDNSDNDNAEESRYSIVTAETLVDAESLKGHQAPRPASTQMKWHSLASVSFSLSSGPPAASKSVSPTPSVRRPAASQPNSAEPDVRQRAASRSDSAQRSMRPSAASRSNSPQQDERRPAASQANPIQPDVRRPAASQSKSPRPDLHRSAASQTDSAQQDLRRPATQQSNSGQPYLQRAAAPPATQPSESMKTPPVAQVNPQAAFTQPNVLRSNAIVIPRQDTTNAKTENAQAAAQSMISHSGMFHSTNPTAPQPVFTQYNSRHTSTGSVPKANLIQPGVYVDQRHPVVSTQAQNHPVTQTVAQSSTHHQQSLACESQRLSQLERTECMQQQNIARSSGLQVQIMREQLANVLPQCPQLTAILNDISHHYRAIDVHYNNIQQHHRLFSKHHLTAQHMLQNHAQISAPRPDSSHHPYQSLNNNAYMHNQHQVMVQQHHTSDREHDRRSIQNLERSQSMDVARNDQNLIQLSRESFRSLQRSNADVAQSTTAHQTQFNANGMACPIPSQQNGPVKSGHPTYGSFNAVPATMPPPMASIQQPAVTQNTSVANTHNRTMSHSYYRVPVSVSTGGNIGMAILEERQREMASKPSVGRSLAEQRRRASNKVDEDDMPLAALRRDPAVHTTLATQQQTIVNPNTTSTKAMQQLASQQAKDLLGAFSPRKVPSMPVALVQATDHTHPQNAAHTSGIDKNVAAPKMGFRSLPQTSPHPLGTSRASEPVHGPSSSQRVPHLPATMTQPDSVPYMAFTAINSGNRAVSTPVITAAQAIPAHQASTAEIPRDAAAAKVQDIQEWVIIDKD